MKIFLHAATSGVLLCVSLGFAGDSLISSTELREKGVFEFPQKDAKIICDLPDVRLSVWNNSEYLFAQAIFWNDGDESIGQTDDGRKIGDWSVLMLDLDADGKATKSVDRNYMLNPWPGLEGLRYQTLLGEGSSTGIKSDSKGRGAVRYIEKPDGGKIRVDTYLIPLSEISRKVGQTIRLCFWGSSPEPQITFNSGGYDHAGKSYYSFHVPRSKYSDYLIDSGAEIDTTKVPEGRNDISLAPRKTAPMPKAGDSAPEISAKEWINRNNAPTLTSLRGNVVLVEFWATWCGPCVQCIPNLNKIHKKFSGKNFQLLSFTQQNKEAVEKFRKKTPIHYTIGLESDEMFDRYGVTGIPHAFLINPSGKIVWEGHSASAELENAIEKALASAK